MIRYMSVDRSTSKRAGEGPGDSVIHDPRALRALAHPVRLAILNYLRTVDSATASDCATALGAVPSACSFHLRVLARFGLVEEDTEAPSHGRRRPWRARPVQLEVEQQLSEAEPDDAFQAWQSMRAEVEAARLRALERDADYPAEWRRAIGGDQLLLTVTAEELVHLRWAISHLCDGVRSRGRDGSDGRLPIDVVIDYVPRFTPEDAGAPDDG
jgi:DNA-binding transcriptional ArsR family regulator